MNRMYRTVVAITDFGPHVEKIIIKLPMTIEAGMVGEETFSVYVDRRDPVTGETVEVKEGWMSDVTFPSRGYCEIEAVYVSDAEGNKAEEGDFVTIILPTRPMYALSSKLVVLGHHNTFVFNDFTITQVKTIGSDPKTAVNGLVYDRFISSTAPGSEGWVNGISSHETQPLGYGYYAPVIGSGKRPLVIWLHGGGEGGNDPTIAYTGNQVINLSKEEVQTYFGGAYVLAPQSPTMWMDDGVKVIGESGETIYLEALKSLIDEFILLHDDIDTNRIYLGGCSNGGFMTLKFIIAHPDYFAAAYPVCEALYDKFISDEDINAIKDIPIWFTHAKNDTIVDPELTVVPTYKRLIEAGGKNIHFSYFDEVIDSRGYKYENFGHASWIQMLNDDCRLDYDDQPVMFDGEEVTLLQWLAKQ